MLAPFIKHYAQLCTYQILSNLCFMEPLVIASFKKKAMVKRPLNFLRLLNQ